MKVNKILEIWKNHYIETFEQKQNEEEEVIENVEYDEIN